MTRGQKYETELKLGDRYKDSTTGIDGHLVAIHFYEHACVRGTLRYVDSMGNPQEVSFDAPEMVHVETDKPITADKPGGPKRAEGQRLS